MQRLNIKMAKHITDGGEIVDSMPEGYYIDKLAPSPLFGHVFIVNAPVLKGSNRKLLKLKEH